MIRLPSRRCGSNWQRERRLNAALERLHLFELLEERVLLSSAAFVATSTNLHNIQDGPLAKAGGNLASLYLDYRSAQKTNTLSQFVSKAAAQTSKPGESAVDVVGNTVGVEVVGTGSLSSFESSMEALGMSIQSITPKDDAIAGFVPITLLSQIAQSSNVLHVTPLSKPVASQEGVAPNQADQALEAATARTDYGLTGKGVTVGVISTSVNRVGGGLAASEATGDLPKNVKVIQDAPANNADLDTDEGRAILEEIYDLAPGANLVFDTCGSSQQSEAAAVTALQQAGCNVIIDDIGFEEEPFFQPGVIDAAINTAVANGVTYVTAAGNSGDAGFEQAATFVPASDGSGDELINFNPGGTVATKMTITLGTDADEDPTDLTLEWDDPYDGVTGTVKADLEINLYSADGQELVASGNDNTFATGVPVQQIAVDPVTGLGGVSPGTYQVQIVATNTPKASLPGYYEFVFGDLASSLTTQYPGTQTTVVGHSAFSDAISVGAVPFYSAPPFSTTQPIPTETFSSQGPAVEARDVNGDLLATAQTEDVPNVSGVDGNNTSFFVTYDMDDPTTYPQFFGTSAAAGNVAGVVALLKQEVPGATPAQIETALEMTATPVNGQTADTYNTTGGYGLVNTVSAVAELISETTTSGGSGGTGGTTSTPPAATIVGVSPNPRSTPVSSIEIEFNEPVSGLTLGDLDLTLNGGANLLTVNQTLETTNDQDFVLGNLSSLTAAYGDYTLALVAVGSDIKGPGGQVLADGASTSFVVEAITGIPAVPTNLEEAEVTSTSVTLSFEEPVGNDLQGYVLERATNPGFTGKVTTIYLPVTSTLYTDNNLNPDTVYYYQIDAYNTDGTSSFSHAATAITYATNEVIMDTNSPGVTIDGAWNADTTLGGYEGADYLQDNDTGKGSKSVKYRPDLPTAGEYDVYATWTTAPDHSTSVPIDVFNETGDLLATVRVNERSTGGDGFVYLGTFFLHSSTASFVRIRNTGTSGEVIANAIKFLPAGDLERNDVPLAPITSAAAPDAQRASAAAMTKSDETAELKVLHDEVDS